MERLHRLHKGDAENFFRHGDATGMISRGESVEVCFANMAYSLFSLMADVERINAIHIITFEFSEADLEIALTTWLNLLLAKADEHHLLFSDFRLKKEGELWKATVSGEPRREAIERDLCVKAVTLSMLLVRKIEHTWEARCVISI